MNKAIVFDIEYIELGVSHISELGMLISDPLPNLIDTINNLKNIGKEVTVLKFKEIQEC